MFLRSLTSSLGRSSRRLTQATSGFSRPAFSQANGFRRSFHGSGSKGDHAPTATWAKVFAAGLATMSSGYLLLREQGVVIAETVPEKRKSHLRRPRVPLDGDDTIADEAEEPSEAESQDSAEAAQEKKKRKSKKHKKNKKPHETRITYIETAEESPIKIFSGSGNPGLAGQIASILGSQLGRATLGQYADGECRVQLHDNVRGQVCYVVQSITQQPNDKLLELLLMASSLKRASAERVVAVLPYLGYSRQLQSKHNAQSMAGADVARLLEASGVDHVVAVDLHRAQIQGFFERIPVENLDTTASAAPYFSRKDLVDPVIVAPSGGTVQRAIRFRDELSHLGVEADMALLYTESAGEFVDTDENHHSMVADAQIMRVVGDVEGRDCLIIDDMVDSGSRVSHAAEALSRSKARRIYAYTTHGLLTGNAVQRIEESPLNELVICNTVPLPTENWSPMIRQLSVAGLLAECILRMHNQESLLDMYDDDRETP